MQSSSSGRPFKPGLGERAVKRKANGEDRVATYAPAGRLPEIIEAFEKARKASSKTREALFERVPRRAAPYLSQLIELRK